MSIYKKVNATNRGIKYIMFILLLIIILIILKPQGIDKIYIKNYWVDCACLIGGVSIFAWNYQKRKYDIFSPITVFSALYFMMFFVTPIYDIICREYKWFGVDLFKFGIKGSLIAFSGYLIFFVMYNNKFRWRTSKRFSDDHTSALPERKEVTNKHIAIILIGYLICLVANVYYLINTSGNSLLYIFTLGILGMGEVSEIESNIGAISMLSYALPSFTLLYMEYGKKKVLKVVLFSLMFVLQITRGFRFFILQIIIMFGSYYYLRENKKPKFKNIIAVIFFALIPIVIMTVYRNSVRAGMGVDLSILTSDVIRESLDEAFWDNLRIYKTYYGIIRAVPSMTDYLYGKQIIAYTIIMIIPRALWPNKPGNPGTEAQALGIGQAAVDSGSAYPCLGEYYYELGWIGVLLCMAFFGSWLKKSQIRYRFNAKSPVDKMIYSTILGLILQLTIRGYTPSNFWLLIFCMIPFWFFKKLVE